MAVLVPGHRRGQGLRITMVVMTVVMAMPMRMLLSLVMMLVFVRFEIQEPEGGGHNSDRDKMFRSNRLPKDAPGDRQAEKGGR